MAKETVSARIDAVKVNKLKKVADAAGMTLTSVVDEAIARYLGEDVATVGNRIERLEKDVEDLKNRLRGLAG